MSKEYSMTKISQMFQRTGISRFSEDLRTAILIYQSKKRESQLYLNGLVTFICGLIVLLISTVVMLGWIFDLSIFVSGQQYWAAMVMNTAICCFLSGLTLFSFYIFDDLADLHIHKAIGLIVLIISSVALVETLFGINLYLDFTEFHQLLQPNYAHPGRMAPNTCIGLGLFGLALLSLRQNYKQNSFIKYLAIIIMVIGATGFVGYAFNIKALYSWSAVLQMSLPASICVTLLGIGLWNIHSYLRYKQKLENEFELNKIATIAALILTVVSIIIWSTAFIFESKTTNELMSKKIAEEFKNKLYFIKFDLSAREQRALVAASNANLIDTLENLRKNPNDGNVKAGLVSQANALKEHGFTYVSYLDVQGNPILSFGKLVSDKRVKVDITSAQPLSLMWDTQYYLYAKVAMHAADKTLSGYMITEQSLNALDEYLKISVGDSGTSDIAMCGKSEQHLNCFPSRLLHHPFITSKFHQNERVAMSRALDLKETTINTVLDYRDKRVLAAYGPIGDTGLGLVVKVDLAEIYSPILIQLAKSFVVALSIILFGIFLIWKRLLPLANAINQARIIAEKERQRFLAATEASLDGFYIFQAVRDTQNRITDFICTFVNKKGAELTLTTPESIIGMSVLQYMPYLAGDLYFGTYVKVIETHVPVSDEINIHEAFVDPRWLSRQIVQLGDGVAITAKDITHLKLTELSLIKSKELQSSIIASASYSIIATDQQGTIIAMNKASERMLWYSADELVGKYTPEILHDKDEVVIRAKELSEELSRDIQPGFEVFVAKVKAQISEDHEWTYIRKDGSRLPVNLSVSQLQDEVGSVTGYLGVAHDISERKRAEEYIKHIALHDVLTGLPNRALFDDRVKVAIERAKRNQTQFAIALLDVDHFKRINDSLGHHVGDVLLQDVAQRISHAIRPSDTVARMGGDEFAFLLVDISHPEGTQVILRNLIEALKPKVLVSNYELQISASIGICVYPHDGNDLSVLLRNADIAMYRAKELGRDNFQIFNKEMEEKANKRLTLENQLRTALDKKQFKLFYQSQIDLNSGEIIGFEALMRWEKSPGIMIPPLEFIPIAEDSGLIIPMGEWVIKTACKKLFELQKQYRKKFRMAVNVSAKQFKQKNMMEFILETLTSSGIDPQDFEIEITESILMSDVDDTLRVLTGLKAAGVSITIDDFGTGYSSLSYLKKFQIDRIKIDKSFVKDIISSQQDRTLANAIISMAKSLKIKIIAEGIETNEQYEFIRAAGCEEGQGYLISKPVSEDNLLELLNKDANRINLN